MEEQNGNDDVRAMDQWQVRKPQKGAYATARGAREGPSDLPKMQRHGDARRHHEATAGGRHGGHPYRRGTHRLRDRPGAEADRPALG
ncbi:MAG: hypothetical protein COU32_01850 [Candidatus Magasanikbacteria bacterium CG10_big_fil_rev_8_21_14_0_10_42_10]|uniref:Uncharacterized protein n=2 Tax=Candidatus Magasanikiibacteriota TaxID=1752731 RepID=A0A2H0TWE2_9BACT|nr:MAG: hypothetical protein COU32_01850 [Candidatus Magasanikbacteria bacterium CG10_big_fil_rev_8_21_14_0_10_42_10]PIZ93391.1 MAG: hypothetical protein COX82_02680 [Candidatus Magasanikbacteria bacterium CG_4_10_14_0_2_um_filter_41_10]